MSQSTKKLIFINTAPKANTKKDGSVFYTVLVGLSKAFLAEHNAEHVDTITMNIFENQLETVAESFRLAKENGYKLVVSCDEIVLTEPKTTEFVNRNGELVTSVQASCWATGEHKFDVIKGGAQIGDALLALLNNNKSDDETV